MPQRCMSLYLKCTFNIRVDVLLAILKKSYFANAFIFAVLLYACVIIGYRIRHHRFKFNHFEFSIFRHYIAVSPLFWGAVSYSFLNQSPRFVFGFLLLGLWGMIGEVVAVVYWRFFFKQPIYIYTEGALLNGYTSVINVIPWSAGFIVFSTVNNFLGPKITPQEQFMQLLTMWPVFVVSLILVYVLTALIKKTWKLHEENFSFKDYLIFSLPILTSIGFLSVYYNKQYVVLAAGFGLTAFVIEYLYGKFARWILGRQLWYYPVGSIDDQHTSFLNILPFALGGFWFLFGNLFVYLALSAF